MLGDDFAGAVDIKRGGCACTGVGDGSRCAYLLSKSPESLQDINGITRDMKKYGTGILPSSPSIETTSTQHFLQLD